MNTDDQLKAALKRDAALREAIKLDEMEAPKMPSDLNARLMQRVAQEQAPVATRTRRLWPWIAAACAVAFIAVFLTPPKDIAPTGDATTATPAIVAKVDKPAAQPAAQPVEAPAAPVVAPAPAVVAKAAPKAPKAASKAVEPTTAKPEAIEPAVQQVLAAATTAQPVVAQQKKTVLSERDIPITRPENYKYTPEELAQLKKQAAEAYLKWVELEMEISRNNLEQAQNN